MLMMETTRLSSRLLHFGHFVVEKLISRGLLLYRPRPPNRRWNRRGHDGRRRRPLRKRKRRRRRRRWLRLAWGGKVRRSTTRRAGFWKRGVGWRRRLLLLSLSLELRSRVLLLQSRSRRIRRRVLLCWLGGRGKSFARRCLTLLLRQGLLHLPRSSCGVSPLFARPLLLDSSTYHIRGEASEVPDARGEGEEEGVLFCLLLFRARERSVSEVLWWEVATELPGS